MFLWLFSSLVLEAQNITDALRYSYYVPSGSARVLGVGGSFGAMGGDISSIWLNPAGLGDFRSKELMLNLAYDLGQTDVDFDGQSIGDGPRSNELILQSAGYVGHKEPYYNEKMTAINFAIGFQNIVNYNEVIRYDIQNTGSIVEQYANNANLDEYGLNEFIADSVGAIFYENDDVGYLHDFSNVTVDEFGYPFSTDNRVFAETIKSETIERSGQLSELTLAVAGKWKSGLSLGATLGFPFITYEENRFYSEQDTDNTPLGFNRYNFNETLEIDGGGFNGRVGAGYSWMLNKVYSADSTITGANILRFGLAFHTPSWFRLSEFYSSSMQYDCEFCPEPADLVTLDVLPFYRLNSPMKLLGSLGFIFTLDKLRGFVNLDATYIDYGKNKFNSSSESPDPDDDQLFYDEFVNPDIEFFLRKTFNYNLGTEIVYNQFRFRAGVGLYGAPFDGDSRFDKVYSAGVGIRGKYVYLDLAYQIRQLQQGYAPYDVGDAARNLNLVTQENLSKISATFGVKLGR